MKRFFVSLAKAVFYVVRERKRIWSSRPSLLVILSSIVDGLIVSTLACLAAAPVVMMSVGSLEDH